MEKRNSDRKEVKRRFQLWLKPSTLELADKIYGQDNCASKSEFIEKAIIFYAGYLSSKDNKHYLPGAITSTLKGIVAESDNKTSGLLFKIAVELAILQNLYRFALLARLKSKVWIYILIFIANELRNCVSIDAIIQKQYV